MRKVFRDRGRWCRTVGPITVIGVLTLACTDSTAPGIEIVLSQPSVDFRAIRGTAAPLTRTITVENSGDGRLGPVSCPANPAAWLACSVSNGNSVTLTANPTGLAASPPSVPVTITAEGAPDKPQSVTVNLIIDQPVLTVSASTVNFASSEAGGGTTPGSATVTVTNTGAGTLANLGAISCVPTPANARVSCLVNQNTGVLTLTVDPAGLAPATYVFPVVVSAPNDNVSKTVAVTLAMSAVPRIALSQGSLVFQMLRGAAGPAPQTVTVSNSGGGSLGTVSCPSAPATWLACAVSGATVTFTVNPSGLTASPLAVSVPINATGAANSPQAVTVNFTIRQPVLSVSTTAVAFTAVSGTSTTTPANEKVAVTNTGEGTLANLGTITCTPPAGSPVTCTVDQTLGELTIVVNPTGIAGTQVYSVTVSAPNSNVTRTVTVTLSAAPGIALSPSEVNFQAIRGSTTALIKKVTVNNAGGGTLGAISCPAAPAVWLTCAVTAGDTLTFTANPSGLTTSPADVLVPVMAVGGFNNPQNVTVTFTILQPILSLTASVVNVSIAAGGTTAPVAVTASNIGAGNLASLGTIACTPSEARVACVVNQTTGEITMTVNSATVPALAQGQHVFTVSVTAPNMGNAAQVIAIVVTVT